MANGQFIIPGSPSEVQSLEPQQYTPEAQPAVFAFIKDINGRLESYRDTAVAIEEAKRPWLKSMKSLVLTPKPYRAELIDRESVIGGRRFQKQDPEHDVRFWEEGGEWFFGYSDGKGVTLNDSTIHYEIYDDHIKKSYQGRVVPFANGELEVFTQAVQSYEHDVVHELYPFDEAIQELLDKYNLDEAA